MLILPSSYCPHSPDEKTQKSTDSSSRLTRQPRLVVRDMHHHGHMLPDSVHFLRGLLDTFDLATIGPEAEVTLQRENPA